MGEYRLRAYRPDDAPGVASLVTRTLEEFGFAAQLEAIERELRAIEVTYAAARAGFWVAEDDDGLAGTVAIRPKDDEACELKRLYVRPDRRGTGLGRALYAHAERAALSFGYARIWLVSSRRFAKARRLYEASGFELVESLDNDWEDNLYEKRLPTSRP